MSIGVALLGSTGSIGASALSVLSRHPDRFDVVALAARRSARELERQVDEHRPELAVLVEDGRPEDPARRGGTRWLKGREGLLEAAAHPDADVVLNAVVGAAGLEATLAALDAGKRLALANKESLVAGGPLVLTALLRGGGELVPVDSEHSAILQCLAAGGGPGDGVEATARGVKRIILTASGGPFREWSEERLRGARPEAALKHPTWDMGAKITIDSATLVNKALEVIEAHFLFGIPYDRIEVVVHPQSIIHSMVEFADGSILAQMGFPTMELPILYALTHPERVEDSATCFDPVSAGPLTFEAIDGERFPAFALGVAAGRSGGTSPAVYNAANEEAVAAYLAGRVAFPDIAGLIASVLDEHRSVEVDSIETVLEADRRARLSVSELIEMRC